MAAIDDLISQIEDKALRERLRIEADRITKEKKFGLVFEDHLPELTPVYSAAIRKNSKVALRDGPISDLWHVLSVLDGKANCRNIVSGETQNISVADLVVVRQFGEPIFPALVPVDKVQNGPNDAPWHTLIEADNFHALQLLEYLYSGQVDCIYIDPPYNTGARDWKYNNNYVDGNDSWRHSKWLAFMRRRLLLAKRLLNPKTGVLIVTIDEHEVHHLGMLMEEVFPNSYRQMVTIVITSRGVAAQGLARVEEHALYVYQDDASANETADNFLTIAKTTSKKTPWASLLRRGTNASPTDRAGLVYPIFLDPETREILSVGETLDDKVKRGELTKSELNSLIPERTKSHAWPIRSDGRLGTWQVGPQRLMDLKKNGFIKLGRYDENRNSWAVNYLKRGPISQISRGELVITGQEWENGPVILEYKNESNEARTAKTVWHRTLHDAGTYGSSLLQSIIGTRSFDFPKSLYAVRDTLSTVIGENKEALVVDFFAGSGTTLNAIHLLNEHDGGSRRCIMVTNNEVKADEGAALREQGLYPGDTAWEALGICQSVTWPRSKYTILGKRDDDTELEGEYFTGDTIEIGKPRQFQQIGFTTVDDLRTAAKKKQLVDLIDGISKSELKKDSSFIISEKHPASILFDESQADAWLEALDEQDHIVNFYVVTSSTSAFKDIKARVNDLLGPMIVTEEAKRLMREGFQTNLEYFRLDFLDKDHVSIGRQFHEILPILWMRAGAIGPRPELPKNKPIPGMLLPEHNPFAVLVDETRFADFLTRLEGRSNLDCVYLVTDSEEAFQEMAVQLKVPNVIQLYRDYLENFAINKEEVAL